MKPIQKIFAVVLVLLLGGSICGLLRTGQPTGSPPAGSAANGGAAAQAPLVNQSPLLTAQRLAKMPNSLEEEPFAKEALRLADHQMDLAYAAAEREAEDHPPALSAEAKEIQMRLKSAEDALDADSALVTRLTADDAKATGAKKDALDDQLILATAHQEEHQDEVDDAKGDLEQAGGDPKSVIEKMMEEHKASSQATDALRVNLSALVEERGLIHRFEQWMSLHQKQLVLWNAKQEAESAAAVLLTKHNTLEEQLKLEKNNASPSGGKTNDNQSATGGVPQASLSREDSAVQLKAA